MAANLNDLMSLYAQRGVAEWKTAPASLRSRALKCLGAAIAENDAEASVTMATVYKKEQNENRMRFIPMPKHPKTPGFERSFFLPIKRFEGGKVTISFDVFLIVDGKACLGFRIEPAHPGKTTHGYGHVQMCRSLLRKTMSIPDIPNWIPDKYPAFPLSTSDPLGLFLAMVTAIHGFGGGIVTVVTDMFQKASRARDSAVYLDELKDMLK